MCSTTLFRVNDTLFASRSRAILKAVDQSLVETGPSVAPNTAAMKDLIDSVGIEEIACDIDTSRLQFSMLAVYVPSDWHAAHALDVPANAWIDGDASDMTTFGDRHELFRMVAHLNGPALKVSLYRIWQIGVAIGEPISLDSSNRISFAGDRGVLTETVYRPLTVIRPTVAEIQEVLGDNLTTDSRREEAHVE